MTYQMYVGDTLVGIFRTKHAALFAAKRAIAREEATEVIVFSVRRDGTCIGDFVVTPGDPVCGDLPR